jgi:hypothetical protein
MLSLAAPAMAQNCTSNRVGEFTYTNCTDSNADQWNGTSRSWFRELEAAGGGTMDR